MSASCFKNKSLYHSKVFIAVSIILYSNNTKADDVFDINAINTGIESHVADVNNLDYLSYSGGQLPGTYHVAIYINNKFVDEQNLRFIFDKQNKKLVPEIAKKMLLSWGLKIPRAKLLAMQKMIKQSLISQRLYPVRSINMTLGMAALISVSLK